VLGLEQSPGRRVVVHGTNPFLAGGAEREIAAPQAWNTRLFIWLHPPAYDLPESAQRPSTPCTVSSSAARLNGFRTKGRPPGTCSAIPGLPDISTTGT
jgi:hypothetical protein